MVEEVHNHFTFICNSIKINLEINSTYNIVCVVQTVYM